MFAVKTTDVQSGKEALQLSLLWARLVVKGKHVVESA
jgi:hypothetical protein